MLADCQASDAVLLGAVGGPKWDDPRPKVRPEQGLLALRKGLKVFANLRPVKVRSPLIDVSPLKRERIEGVDILVVRELTGGLYFAQPKERGMTPEGHERAVDTLEYYDYEVRRVVRDGLPAGVRRPPKESHLGGQGQYSGILASVAAGRDRVAAEYPGRGPGSHAGGYGLDAAADPVRGNSTSIVTDNMFGDILTDEASVLAGSMGMLPSASLGDIRTRACMSRSTARRRISPERGSPIRSRQFSAGRCLLRYSLGLSAEAESIERAVDRALEKGFRTADLLTAGKKSISTREMTDQVLGELN